jgi:RimJ/RimL family protein N-acetyltransferase
MDSIKSKLPATLTTDRLVLVTPNLAHVPEMAALANNKAIHAVLSRLPHPYDERHGRDFVENIARGSEEHAWSILLQGTYIGTMGLHILPDKLPALGYWLGQPYWGHGYATEAAHAVVAAARSAGATALGSRALLSNTGSRNVLRKVGFTEIGEDTDKAGTLAGQRVMQMRLEF